MAQRLGFRRPDPTLIATAISELARNLVMHVGHGEIIMRPIVEDRRSGVLVIVRDEGPGIADVDAALRLGRRLPGRTRARAAGGKTPDGRIQSTGSPARAPR